jgi:8-oxo-dGTP diphosphatase
MRRIDVAQALIERDGHVLVVRNRRHDGIEGWGFPGGRRELGETFAEAAAREVREETGLAVEIGRLRALGESLHGSHDVFALFEARVVGGSAAVQPGDVAVELRWVEPERADELMPWYPGGVRRLLQSAEVLYYVERTGW